MIFIISRMTFILNIFNNYAYFIFYAVIIGVRVWSLFKSVPNRTMIASALIVPRERMSSSSSNETITPENYLSTKKQLEKMQKIKNKVNENNQSVETELNVTDVGTQVKPISNLDTVNLDTSVTQTTTIVRTHNFSELKNKLNINSSTSDSVQAMSDLKSTEVQNLVSNLDKGSQTMVKPITDSTVKISTNLDPAMNNCSADPFGKTGMSYYTDFNLTNTETTTDMMTTFFDIYPPF